jgi:hypothetical protein
LVKAELTGAEIARAELDRTEPARAMQNLGRRDNYSDELRKSGLGFFSGVIIVSSSNLTQKDSRAVSNEAEAT